MPSSADHAGVRIVSLVLVDAEGALLGELPPFEVSTPWWQEVGEIDDRYQVLRLLHGDRDAPPGGHVTYLAQTAGGAPVGLRPVRGDLGAVDRADERRLPYAEPGGPRASIDWARAVLGRDVTARQKRTWNLSAIWRLDDDADEPVAWLKQVPPFFAHEPAAIRMVGEVAPGLVPPLLADGPDGRMLLAHVPGEDRYGAGPDLCAGIAAAFHPIQAHFAGRSLPIPAGPRDFARVAEPYRDRIDGLAAMIDDLPRRFAEVEACGLPLTLVHGDLHPGNVRTAGDGRLTILDWGDCTVDHPAFDILRLTGGLDDPDALLGAWVRRWQDSVPGSDPRRAVELLRPVAGLRAASVYAGFLANIETAEHPYHAADVPEALAGAVAAKT